MPGDHLQLGALPSAHARDSLACGSFSHVNHVALAGGTSTSTVQSPSTSSLSPSKCSNSHEAFRAAAAERPRAKEG